MEKMDGGELRQAHQRGDGMASGRTEISVMYLRTKENRDFSNCRIVTGG